MMANGSSDDEKREDPPTEMMNDPKEQGKIEEVVKSLKLTVVIPKFEMEGDDELEEFKTPTGPKYRIPPPLVCPPAPKRKRKFMPETPHMVFFQTPLSVLYGKFARANKKPKSD